MIISIDGPTASGKSTVGLMLAKRLGFYYLNTGFLYRAVAYLLINHSSYSENALKNPDPIDLKFYLDPDKLIYEFDDEFKARIIFDGMNITPRLKTSFIDKGASIVSTSKMVRELLLQIQRVVSQKFNLVAEGRDIGSVVFQEADIKIYLTASVKIRAERWRVDQMQKGNKFSEQEAIDIVNDRDRRDKEREMSPLVIPDNAIVIDNSDMDIQQTLDRILDLIKKTKMIENKI